MLFALINSQVSELSQRGPEITLKEVRIGNLSKFYIMYSDSLPNNAKISCLNRYIPDIKYCNTSFDTTLKAPSPIMKAVSRNEFNFWSY